MKDAARIDDLERRLCLLRQAADRLVTTPRVFPGTVTFWSGPARRRYERTIVQLDEDVDAGVAAIREAIGTASGLLGTLRHGG